MEKKNKPNLLAPKKCQLGHIPGHKCVPQTIRYTSIITHQRPEIMPGAGLVYECKPGD